MHAVHILNKSLKSMVCHFPHIHPSIRHRTSTVEQVVGSRQRYIYHPWRDTSADITCHCVVFLMFTFLMFSQLWKIEKKSKSHGVRPELYRGCPKLSLFHKLCGDECRHAEGCLFPHVLFVLTLLLFSLSLCLFN